MIRAALKATNRGPQRYSDNMMPTSCKKIIKATTWGSRHNILPQVVAWS